MVRLIPRETKFFDLFADIANNVIDGARVLSELLNNYDYQKMPDAVARITDIEHRGDEMTHQILVKLNQTFITPFDREDIHLMASSLDDVLDFIFSAADRLLNYKIVNPRRPPRCWPASSFGRPKNSARPSPCLAKKDKFCSTASKSIAWRTRPTR